MKKSTQSLEIALKEYLLNGEAITQLESVVLFGVSNLYAAIMRLRKDGWVVNSNKIPYAKAMTRLNKYTKVSAPENLPIREIYLTEYWISQ